MSVQLSLPKELMVTQPLGPPVRASSIVLPSCSISLRITSVLKSDGWPMPVRATSQARFKNCRGFFRLNWMQALGWMSRISSTTSRIKYDTSLTASRPAGVNPPRLINAKSW